MLVGSPELKPETSVSQEIALLWDGQQGLNTGLTLFNTDFEDKISEIRRCESKSNPSCTLNGHTYDFISDRINVDKANMRGVEGTANWTINDAWSLASSYTFTQSEQKSGAMEGKPLNQMPRHMFNTTVDWQTTETVSLWSRVNFRSKTSDYLSRVKMAEGTLLHLLRHRSGLQGQRTPGCHRRCLQPVRQDGGLHQLRYRAGWSPLHPGHDLQLLMTRRRPLWAAVLFPRLASPSFT